MENKLLTAKEAAKYLGIHYVTILRYLESGELKGYKVGPRWRVKLEDLEAFLKENR